LLTDFEEDVEIDGADGNNNSDQPDTHGANVSMAATIARATKRFRSQCWKEYVQYSRMEWWFKESANIVRILLVQSVVQEQARF